MPSICRLSRRLLPDTRWLSYFLLFSGLWSTVVWGQKRPITLHPDPQPVINLLAMSGPEDPDLTHLLPRLDSIRQQAIHQQNKYLAAYCQLLNLRSRLVYASQLIQGRRLLEQDGYDLLASPFPAIQAGYWHVYGRYLLQHRQFKESFRYLFQAQQQLEQIGYANVPEVIDYLYGMGQLYFRFGDYLRAIHYLNLAERYHPAQPLRLRTVVLNLLGLAYQHLGDYPRASHSFQTALKLAYSLSDSANMGIVSGNLGNTLRLQGRLRQALPYLYQDLSLSQQLVPENCATTCLYLAKVLLVLDSTAKAKRYLDRSVELAATHSRRGIYLLNNTEARAQYARKTGDLTSALHWTDSTAFLKDSLGAVFDRTLLMAGEHRLQAEGYLARLQTLADQQTQAVRIRNGSIAVLLLLTAIGLYALRQKSLQQRQQQQLAAQQLAAAQAQLAQYLSSLREKNELIARFQDELTQAQQRLVTVPATTASSLQALLERVILTEQDWRQFRNLFEGVYPGFFEGLKRDYPDLSPAELRLLVLSKLELPTKEMASMLGVSPEAIRKSRYRLRKKLRQHHPDTDLVRLLASE